MNVRVNNTKCSICKFSFWKMNVYTLRAINSEFLTLTFYLKVELWLFTARGNRKTGRKDIFFREVTMV